MDNGFRLLMCRSAEKDVAVNAVIKDETIWLTQKAMAELFNVDKSTIRRHLKNIFREGELDKRAAVAKSATTTLHDTIEGKPQTTNLRF
ncbi:death-on-curing protein [uncultured Dysosmobacter sp.]|uniref:death-on-curing protein n=1 Tax=uncultured Dysosmobacter sp. TaxID=2591384 RepID=UPI0026133FD9|nr:death-on-curing protein [uncultured Dysosmobacter sp.]